MSDPATSDLAAILAASRCRDVHSERSVTCRACESWGAHVAQVITDAGYLSPEAVGQRVREAEARALREAADECHREARWQTEQERRYGVIHQYAEGRTSLLEQILRDRADRIERGEP